MLNFRNNKLSIYGVMTVKQIFLRKCELPVTGFVTGFYISGKCGRLGWKIEKETKRQEIQEGTIEIKTAQSNIYSTHCEIHFST